MKDNKGFTLIELLAVIIILGILMLVAIPSVTNYINNSRKNSYINTAKELVRGASILVNSGEFESFNEDTTYYIPSTCIDTESGGKSPYGGIMSPAYIIVTNDDDTYNYYWISTDEQGMGIKRPVPIDKIDSSMIETGVESSDITAKFGIDGRSSIVEIDSDCSSKKDAVIATKYVSIDGEDASSPFNLGDYLTYIPDDNSYTISADITGYREDTFNSISSGLTLWRVIHNYDDGRVDIVSEYLSNYYVRFGSVKGYQHCIDELQKLSRIFSKEGYSVGTRIMGYDGQTLILEDTSAYEPTPAGPPQTRSTASITSGVGQEYSGGVLGDTLYIRDYLLVKAQYGDLRAYRLADLNHYEHYWLASRAFNYSSSSNWSFTLRIISHIDYNSSYLGTSGLCIYNNSYFCNSNSSTVRPIVTLRSGIKIDSGEGTKDNPYILK